SAACLPRHVGALLPKEHERNKHSGGRRAKMKIILLVLSGDASRARDALAARYPQSQIEEISRAQIENRKLTRRVSALRSLRPDILAWATERLAWQRGQNAFLLLGALAGARRT